MESERNICKYNSKEIVIAINSWRYDKTLKKALELFYKMESDIDIEISPNELQEARVKFLEDKIFRKNIIERFENKIKNENKCVWEEFKEMDIILEDFWEDFIEDYKSDLLENLFDKQTSETIEFLESISMNLKWFTKKLRQEDLFLYEQIIAILDKIDNDLESNAYVCIDTILVLADKINNLTHIERFEVVKYLLEDKLPNKWIKTLKHMVSPGFWKIIIEWTKLGINNIKNLEVVWKNIIWEIYTLDKKYKAKFDMEDLIRIVCD